MASTMADDLNISLAASLCAQLQPLPTHLPAPLAAQLSPYLTVPSPPTIPYSLLSSISKWSRSSSFPACLESKDYTMIALLAGTTTSPERHFPPHIPKADAEESERKRAKEDRNAITALVNGLLSIGGAGIATWWVAEGRGWKDEWRALLALLVAIVVALSEMILYIIWQSRRTHSSTKYRRARPLATKHKKDDDGDDEVRGEDAKAEQHRYGLRKRAVKVGGD